MLNPIEAGQCAVCRRPEEGWGYLPPNGRGKQKRPPVWTCRDHIDLAREVFHMPAKDLTTMEVLALREAGSAAGEYLDSLGKTDLAQLSADEWFIFLERILNRFGEEMRDRLQANVAPF